MGTDIPVFRSSLIDHHRLAEITAPLEARVAQLEAVLREIRKLPTFSISQGIIVDASPEKFLKAQMVFIYVDAAIGSESETEGKANENG